MLCICNITKLYKDMKAVFKMSSESYTSPELSMVSIRAERGFVGSEEFGGSLDNMHETNGNWD